jgi:hypothetical protein
VCQTESQKERGAGERVGEGEEEDTCTRIESGFGARGGRGSRNDSQNPCGGPLLPARHWAPVEKES